MRRRIFVFGSNLVGDHCGGAALWAHLEHGAQMGVGEGLTGESYALPTCRAPGQRCTLERIATAALEFRHFAIEHPELDFLLTAVGCGIAGFTPAQIAPLFHNLPNNVYLQAKLVQP